MTTGEKVLESLDQRVEDVANDPRLLADLNEAIADDSQYMLDVDKAVGYATMYKDGITKRQRFRDTLNKDNDRRVWKATEISDMHKRVIRLIFLGHRHGEISRILKLDPRTVGTITNSPIVRQQLDAMQGSADTEAIDVGKRIESIIPKALDIMEEALNKGTVNNLPLETKEVLKQANNMVDRHHGKPIQKREVRASLAVFDATEIERMKSASASTKQIVDSYQDAEVIDVEETEEDDE